MNSTKKLYRYRNDRKLLGVCSGLAAYLGVDATIVRLIWAVCILAAGFGVLAYLICALIIPETPPDYVEAVQQGRIPRLKKSQTDKKIAGVCGGIAEHFGFDATVLRVVWVITALFAGAGFWGYIIAAIVMD